jgi:uncharacterized protein YciI
MAAASSGDKAFAQTTSSKSDLEILRQLKEVEWPRAYREQDTKLLDSILADEFQMVRDDGIWSNKQKELEYIKTNKPSYDSFRFEIKRLDVLENGTAVVAGTGHIGGKDKEGQYKVEYQSSNILIKRDSVWKAISSHVSGVKRTAVGSVSKEPKEKSDAKRMAEMKKLDFLVGTWKGTGWVMTQNGRQTSTITETFQYKLGGQIAVIEGSGITKDEKTGVERPTHQAFGIFSYDKASGKIKFRYFKAETGEEGETIIEPTNKSLTWGFDVNETGSRVKFIQQVNEKGKWIETGEFSRDGGKTWTKFMEIELSKVSEPVLGTKPTNPNTRYFVFQYAPGPAWLKSKPVSEQPLNKHFDYMKKLEAEKILLLGGPFKDASGAMGIIQTSSLEEAKRIIEKDPAVKEEVVLGEVRAWHAAVGGCVERKE